MEARKCFEGILWVLWTGAPWSELPKEYGSSSTCWRRLQEWEQDGTLLEKTLDTIKVKRSDPGRPRTRPERLIADRGYDSNKIRKILKKRHIEPIIPARCNNKAATDQDGRKLRRYRRRWIVKRSIGWLGNFRRLTVRWDRDICSYAGFFHLACALIVLRKVLK